MPESSCWLNFIELVYFAFPKYLYYAYLLIFWVFVKAVFYLMFSCQLVDIITFAKCTTVKWFVEVYLTCVEELAQGIDIIFSHCMYIMPMTSMQFELKNDIC